MKYIVHIDDTGWSLTIRHVSSSSILHKLMYCYKVEQREIMRLVPEHVIIQLAFSQTSGKAYDKKQNTYSEHQKIFTNVKREILKPEVLHNLYLNCNWNLDSMQ